MVLGNSQDASCFKSLCRRVVCRSLQRVDISVLGLEWDMVHGSDLMITGPCTGGQFVGGQSPKGSHTAPVKSRGLLGGLWGGSGSYPPLNYTPVHGF